MDEPTSAILRAVRLIRAHSRVVTLEDNLATDLSIVVHIDAGLNNRWRAVGASPNGVRAIEPVTFRFSRHYPADMPDVALRADFDRSHPHLVPGPLTEPPRPCYIDGSPLDLIRLRGPQGLVTQLADWLEKAAATELINPTQGWEPVRRDRFDDFVEADAQALRELIDADGGGAFFFAPFTVISDRELRCYCCHLIERIPLRPDIAPTLSDRYGQIGIGVAVWPRRNFIADRYQPETVTNVSELFERAKTLGLFDSLRTNLGLLQRRLQAAPVKTPVVISVVLLVRRPLDLIGQTSPIEILPYVIEIHGADELSPSSLHPVRLAAHRDTLSPKLLSKISGAAMEDIARWTLLGAGSVGSKLALHLAREGKAPSAIVDNGFLSPHNFARHGLLPRSRFETLNDAKAHALRDAIALMGQTTTSYFTDMLWLGAAADEDQRNKVWPRGTRFLVDATGSPAVTDVLCLPEVIKTRPRAVETSLFGKGRVAYLAVEGDMANPNLQDLAAEAYRLFSGTKALEQTVFPSDGDLISIGQGCSTLTARMSDATLSAPVCAMAMKLSYLLREESCNAYGEIVIGEIAEDLLGQAWQHHKVDPLVILAGENNATPFVRMSRRVVQIIDQTISSYQDVETGGVLVGRFNETTNSFQVVDVIPAPPDSQFKVDLFLLGIKGLTDVLQGYIARSHGTLYPVGTWHNHLADSAASRTDLATGVQLAFGQTFPAVLIIRTPDRFHGLVTEAIGDEAETAKVTVSTISERAG
ncbi:hypothetical protein [Phyllobacterium sophorae]|uniref:hypothetical protein n=1 Tax=Phyllobacterium sophorae TaxID=1520277 RepID=UPI0014728FD6|nr:hypothetical protein [Phyllobacterium sophorae]